MSCFIHITVFFVVIYFFHGAVFQPFVLFFFTVRSQLAQNRADESYAAVVIQRWRRKVTEAREERDRATGEAARRRWAARTLHKAYKGQWRLKLVERSAIRRELASKEEEVCFMYLCARFCVVYQVVCCTGNFFV